MVPCVHAIIDQTEEAASAFTQSGEFGDEVNVVRMTKSVLLIKTFINELKKRFGGNSDHLNCEHYILTCRDVLRCRFAFSLACMCCSVLYNLDPVCAEQDIAVPDLRE